jgi:hypothetical protein
VQISVEEVHPFSSPPAEEHVASPNRSSDVASPGDSLGDASDTIENRCCTSSLGERNQDNRLLTSVRSVKEDEDDAKHNKYCHFCQHVKMRASAMLACSNKGCARRFCEHCLVNQVAMKCCFSPKP